MPTDTNTGTPKKFNKHGRLVIWEPTDTTDYKPLWMQDGSVSIEIGGSEGVPLSDQGALTTTVLDGDERPSFVRFTVRPTEAGISGGAAELLGLLKPAAANGLKTLFRCDFEELDAAGAATGFRVRFDECFLENALNLRGGGAGQDVDALEIVLRCQEAEPAISTF